MVWLRDINEVEQGWSMMTNGENICSTSLNISTLRIDFVFHASLEIQYKHIVLARQVVRPTEHLVKL